MEGAWLVLPCRGDAVIACYFLLTLASAWGYENNRSSVQEGRMSRCHTVVKGLATVRDRGSRVARVSCVEVSVYVVNTAGIVLSAGEDVVAMSTSGFNSS